MPATIVTTATETKNETAVFNQAFIVRISAVAALGGLLFGFDTAIISGTIASIEKYFALNEVSLGLTVSSLLIGCAIGAAFTGKLCDRLGRKKVLLLCGILFTLTGIGTGLATSLPLFVAFRFVGGLAVGAAAMAAPMYIAEAVPAAQRGRLVSLYQLAIVAGILLAYLSNYLLSGDAENGWRWMFASQALPSLLLIVCLFFVPESPRWLVQQNRYEQADATLQKIGGAAYAQEEVRAIRESFDAQATASLAHLLQPRYSRVLWAGIIIAIFQQITGINAILYYAPEIFKQTGVDAGNSLLQTIGVGAVLFVCTWIAIWLIDKSGRKPLLLWGSLVMGLSLVGVALCFQFSYFENYVVLICILLYIAAFAASLGAVTWVILSEIFPNAIRAMALSLATFILWLADFAASFFFPVANKRMGPAATLTVFAVLCFVYAVYIKLRVPETKGRTLEELEQELAGAAAPVLN